MNVSAMKDNVANAYLEILNSKISNLIKSKHSLDKSVGLATSKSLNVKTDKIHILRFLYLILSKQS